VSIGLFIIIIIYFFKIFDGVKLVRKDNTIRNFIEIAFFD